MDEQLIAWHGEEAVEVVSLDPQSDFAYVRDANGNDYYVNAEDLVPIEGWL